MSAERRRGFLGRRRPRRRRFRDAVEGVSLGPAPRLPSVALCCFAGVDFRSFPRKGPIEDPVDLVAGSCLYSLLRNGRCESPSSTYKVCPKQWDFRLFKRNGPIEEPVVRPAGIVD